MKFSLIIPIYNVEKYIEQCLTSILEQSYKNLEIILVNDGTKDNSMKVIEKYLSDSRIKVINKENGGLSSARNAGLEIATGEYISFVDSDDWLDKDLYKMLCSKIENEDIILFEYLSISDTQESEELELRKRNHLKKQKEIFGDEEERFFKKVSWSCWTKLYRREFIERNSFRFIEGIIYEDINWEIETIYFAKKIKYIPFLGYYYRISRKDSIMNSKKGELHRKSCKIIKEEIENFLNNNQYNMTRGFLGTLLLEIERMKCENDYKSVKLFDASKIFYKYIFNSEVFREGRLRLLSDYIIYLSTLYSYKKNKLILLRIYVFKIIRKIMLRTF